MVKKNKYYIRCGTSHEYVIIICGAYLSSLAFIKLFTHLFMEGEFCHHIIPQLVKAFMSSKVCVLHKLFDF